MKYTKSKNKIEIFDKSEFNIKQICECGQMFRYFVCEDGSYIVISGDKLAKICELDDKYEVYTNSVNYFVNYFDLDNDYGAIKNNLKHFDVLTKAIENGYGIRIVSADKFETIIEFIISANNNIKRIQKIVEKLCEIAPIIKTEFGQFHRFPTVDELSLQSDEWFDNLGAGYRAGYLKQTIKDLKNVDLTKVEKLSSDELYKWLISLKGVGPKVASCIMLFGFGRREYFPVDTWVEQVYYNHFDKTKRTRKQIQTYFENIFKENSGIVQQYLFYFERSKK